MRCNAGINPELLADQHLIAEYREIPMIVGGLKRFNYTFKQQVPEKLCLGTGHITFWKNKLIYLKNRWDEVVKEMQRRGFKTNVKFEIPKECPNKLKNDWKPSLEESLVIRNRIEFKLKLKPKFYKWHRKSITNINQFISTITNSKVNKV